MATTGLSRLDRAPLWIKQEPTKSAHSSREPDPPSASPTQKLDTRHAWATYIPSSVKACSLVGFAAIVTVLWNIAPRTPIPLPSTGVVAKHGTDRFGGKTLTPTNYSVVTGVFRQDMPDFFVATGYDLLDDSFGLLDKSPGRWRNFTNYITTLNRNADSDTTYKVIYIARHGEGYHNMAESTYGTPAWNCYWSVLNTDGNITWGPDATLDSKGIAQAKAVNTGWRQQMADDVPLPQTLYSSPLRRALATLEITWNDILLNRGHIPRIKEQFREAIGLHTCDKRATKTVISSFVPGWHLDADFTEHDEQWNPIYEEQSAQQALRTRLLLNSIFAHDPSTFISITAHSGTITGFFAAVGHQQFSVQTGGFVPVIVKAVSYTTARMAVITGGQSGTKVICTADPTTLVKVPATVTVQPTWYPNCRVLTNLPPTFLPTTGCYTYPVSSSLAVPADEQDKLAF